MSGTALRVERWTDAGAERLESGDGIPGGPSMEGERGVQSGGWLREDGGAGRTEGSEGGTRRASMNKEFTCIA